MATKKIKIKTPEQTKQEIAKATLDNTNILMPKIELFLRELQATDFEDYNVVRDRVAAIVEELEMKAATATILDLYEICSRIDEDIEGQYEDEEEPPDVSEKSSPSGW